MHLKQTEVVLQVAGGDDLRAALGCGGKGAQCALLCQDDYHMS